MKQLLHKLNISFNKTTNWLLITQRAIVLVKHFLTAFLKATKDDAQLPFLEASFLCFILVFNYIWASGINKVCMYVDYRWVVQPSFVGLTLSV